jgi:protease-4
LNQALNVHLFAEKIHYMNSIQLFSSILKGNWLVDPLFAISQGPFLATLLNKKLSIKEIETDPMSVFAVEPHALSGARHSYYHGFDKAPQNSVAIISLKGALMKEKQFCGPAGMAEIGAIIQEADNHHNIIGMVLHIDSPGGTVDGTEALANIIKAANKPVISFVDGLMASAALWIGSSADETFASTDTDQIGSVGVVMSFMDIQPFYEKKGVKFHSIVAGTSPDKIKMWEDLRAGKYENYINDVLNPLDEKFMAAVRENCPNATKEHLTGKVFFARDVMGVFVNQIGTLNDAVLRVAELANNASQDPNSKSNSNTFSMKQFTKLNAALNVETLESVDQSVSLNEEQLQLIETALEETDNVQALLDTANANAIQVATEHQTAVDAANADRDAAVAALADAISAFDAIGLTVAAATTPEAKAAAILGLLSAIPGAGATGTLEDKDPDGSANKDADWDAINALEHNQNVK